MEILTNNDERKRRSVSLNPEERKAFLKLLHSFPTKVDAEEYFKVKRQVLDLVALRGSGRFDTIAAIREKLTHNNKAA